MNVIVSRTALAVALFAAVSTTAAKAQTAFTGSDEASIRNEALLDAIESDAERDVAAFGNEGRPQGFTGSFALRGIAASGNSESVDIGIGTDLDYVDGPNGYGLQLNYSFGSEAGVKTEESLIYGLEYTRDFTPQFFGFAKLQGSSDSFASITNDTFVGVGAGYRIINRPDLQWSVQAGPGYRFANLSAVAAADVSEAAFAISSDYSHKLSDRVSVTNDTDIIASNFDTAVLNDLAISLAMSEGFALRASLLTEYHSDPEPGFSNTDNTAGISLVYSFN